MQERQRYWKPCFFEKNVMIHIFNKIRKNSMLNHKILDLITLVF